MNYLPDEDPLNSLLALEEGGGLKDAFTPFSGKSALLQQQMLQAQALRDRRATQRNTAGGAIGSGLGAMAQGIGGQLQMNDIQGQQEQLLTGKQDEATKRTKMIIDALRKQREGGVRPGVGAQPNAGVPSDVPMMDYSIA